MTCYEFGDVVLAPFPFTDQTTTKKRPAIVVSSAAYHHERPDLIIMAVTSQLRPSATVGIEESLILRKLGRLEETDRQALQHVLQAILGT
jgi:mRNA interferase MazF